MSKLSSNEPESAIRFATAQKQCMMTWQVAVEAGLQVCGGKGYSLALLDSYGFPVPKGGVLSATVYQDLISVERYRRNIEEGVPFELSPSVKASIHDFLGGENLLSKPLAVRSSATSEDSPYASFTCFEYADASRPEKVRKSLAKCDWS